MKTALLVAACLLALSGCGSDRNRGNRSGGSQPSGSAPSGNTSGSTESPTTETAARSPASRPATDTGATAVLPETVARTRRLILEAIAKHDDAALNDQIERGPRYVPFSYTFGGPMEGGPVAYWKAMAEAGQPDPLVVLGQLLQGAPAHRDTLYVWPSWFDAPLVSFSEARRESMDALMGKGSWDMMRPNGFYIGPRTAIRTDGVWMYYVSGD